METNTNNVIIIEPQLGQIITADLPTDTADSGFSGFAGARGEFLKGNCTVFTLPSGDRIIAGPRGVGKLDSNGEEFLATSAQQGAFAILSTPVVPTDKQAEEGFTAQDGLFLAEVLGPALLVGPKPVDGPDDFTPTTLPLEEMRKRIAFNKNGLLGHGLGSLLAALLASAPDEAEVDSAKTGEWDASVFDPELVEYRKTLTAAELSECGCPGCERELEERAVKAAGGSVARN